MTPRAALALGTSLALSGALWAALPSFQDILDPHLPTWAEEWLYNPRERMGQAVDAYERGKPEEGVEAAETALRLAADDPLVQYGAGTMQLGAGHERRAIERLEKAAKAAAEQAKGKKLPPGLAPDAFYNLGNAKLASRDAGGAVDAYKQALRLAPDHASAKHNLEIALREQRKQSQGAGGGNRQGNRGKQSQGDQQSGRRGGQGAPDDNPSSQDRQDAQGGDRRQPQQSGSQGQPGQAPQPSPNPNGDPRLPQFQNQPDMSAREAAGVLQAVENLERQQRQKEAARRAQQSAFKEKDW